MDGHRIESQNRQLRSEALPQRPTWDSGLDVDVSVSQTPNHIEESLIALSDISYAAYQYETQGQLSNSMLIVIALHSLYVLDFFANEDWYLRTIDIAHDVRIAMNDSELQH